MKGFLTFGIKSDNSSPGIASHALSAAELGLVAGVVAKFQERLCDLQEHFNILIEIGMIIAKDERKLTFNLRCETLKGFRNYNFNSTKAMDIWHIESQDVGAIADTFLNDLRTDLEEREVLGEIGVFLYEFLKKSKLRLVA